MSRPKFFRDPLHLQIRFDLSTAGERSSEKEEGGSALLSIIDTPEFQRLRFIRQNGLANLVFHGAEHSRFTHSLGVMHVASVMHERICRNMSEPEDADQRLRVQAASLIHDVGHGPFSHTLEEILKKNGVDFHHEAMTVRLISESESQINAVLRNIDSELPGRIVEFFDPTTRQSEHWSYRLVSSQMDADRLDYVQRDALFAGLRGHGFDIERIFDLLYHENNSIAVDRGAVEAVEAYLVTIDQLYRAVYYHHAVRAATQMLLSLFKRAIDLYKDGNKSIFPPLAGSNHPIVELIEAGDSISLSAYAKLTDFSVWSLIDQWQHQQDQILSDLSRRLIVRDLFKTLPFDAADFQKAQDLVGRAKDLANQIYGDGFGEYYVMVDEPSRTSYKVYNWRPDTPYESIWLIGGEKGARPLEDEEGNVIVNAFKDKKYFHRIVMPAEVRRRLRSA